MHARGRLFNIRGTRVEGGERKGLERLDSKVSQQTHENCVVVFYVAFPSIVWLGFCYKGRATNVCLHKVFNLGMRFSFDAQQKRRKIKLLGVRSDSFG